MSIEAMKQALEALELLARYENPETRIQVRKPKDGKPIVTMYPHKVATDAATVLRTAIEQAEKQEPVAWPCEIEEADFEQDTITLKMLTCQYVVRAGKHWLSTTPTAAQRQPLTEEQLKPIANEYRILFGGWVVDFARAIEAAHGIKETNT